MQRPLGRDPDVLGLELFVFVGAGQDKGFGAGGTPLLHPGNDIRVLKVVGLSQVGGRKMRLMIGM